MAKYKNKKLSKKIPGERYVIMDKDGNTEEVRTCYDRPQFLPRYEDNEDDEDLSDCYSRFRPRPEKRHVEQMRCDIANWWRQQLELEEERQLRNGLNE